MAAGGGQAASANALFEGATVYETFPTHIWEHQLAFRTYDPLNRQIKAKLAAMRTEAQRGGLFNETFWQSQTNLHEEDALSGLVECISGAVDNVLSYLDLVRNEFFITGCWANIASPSAHHRPHTHGNNYLSGVYYVQVAEGARSIEFADPRPQTRIISPPANTDSIKTRNVVPHKVREGMLIVFPSWLSHSVPMNESDHERISISFNIMFNQYAETMSGPKWGARPNDRG